MDATVQYSAGTVQISGRCPPTPTLRNALTARLAIPKGKMVLWRAAVFRCADHDSEQSVMLYKLASLESAHGCEFAER
jgi:hypothetical protein